MRKKLVFANEIVKLFSHETFIPVMYFALNKIKYNGTESNKI